MLSWFLLVKKPPSYCWSLCSISLSFHIHFCKLEVVRKCYSLFLLLLLPPPPSYRRVLCLLLHSLAGSLQWQRRCRGKGIHGTGRFWCLSQAHLEVEIALGLSTKSSVEVVLLAIAGSADECHHHHHIHLDMVPMAVEHIHHSVVDLPVDLPADLPVELPVDLTDPVVVDPVAADQEGLNSAALTVEQAVNLISFQALVLAGAMAHATALLARVHAMVQAMVHAMVRAMALHVTVSAMVYAIPTDAEGWVLYPWGCAAAMAVEVKWIQAIKAQVAGRRWDSSALAQGAGAKALIGPWVATTRQISWDLASFRKFLANLPAEALIWVKHSSRVLFWTVQDLLGISGSWFGTKTMPPGVVVHFQCKIPLISVTAAAVAAAWGMAAAMAAAFGVGHLPLHLVISWVPLQEGSAEIKLTHIEINIDSPFLAGSVSQR